MIKGSSSKEKRLERLKIYTDGASRGNPGPSAYAFVFVKDDKILHEGSGFIGKGTNNTAEYKAIINALKAAEQYTKGEIEVYSDSELVIKQINREYRINKEHLLKLCEELRELCRRFESVKFNSVRRGNRFIKEADNLCNICLDKNRGS
ncbi:MAG: ribonuclease HI family protein [Halobacteriota archaeon]|nr:ribonuclease HI family protein [Halobacteriota archaeon]